MLKTLRELPFRKKKKKKNQILKTLREIPFRKKKKKKKNLSHYHTRAIYSLYIKPNYESRVILVLLC